MAIIGRRFRGERRVSRGQLTTAHFPSAQLGYVVMDLLDEMFEKAKLEPESLTFVGKWDRDAFLIRAQMDN